MSNLPPASWRKLPKWCGFNLLNWFVYGTEERHRDWEEEDFRLINELGFNFVRLPMDYRCWVKDQDAAKIDESKLDQLDDVVKWGQKYAIHIDFAFHRAPGFSVNSSWDDGLDLWGNPKTQELFAEHWAVFARRYKGEPNSHVSFNLVNEPQRYGMANLTPESHRAAIKTAVDAIHDIDPERLIICDGVEWGNRVAPELLDLQVAQSTRFYNPGPLTHYRASWVQQPDPIPPAPKWPDEEKGWSIDYLRLHYAPWKKLVDMGIGVHSGEGGVFIHTPHRTALNFIDDALTVFDEIGIGWAAWEFKGSFGAINSRREDVDYEDWNGDKLDRSMMKLFQRHART